MSVDARGEARRTAGLFGQDEIARLAPCPRRRSAARAAPSSRPGAATATRPPCGRTPSTSSLPLSNFFIGCAIRPLPCSSVRARTRSPTPSALWRPRSCSRSARLGPLVLPALGDRPGLAAIVDIDHAQHGHLGHAAHLVEGAARCAVDQPLVAHVAQQLLERDLVVAGQAERARDLALARGGIGRLDEIEDLLPGGKARYGNLF